MAAIPRIRDNAAWVVKNLGPESGLDVFAFTPESIAWLDQYIERQKAQIAASNESVNKFVSLLGAYLGECIVFNYGGDWFESPEGLAISIQAQGQFHILRPFKEVYERIAKGMSDSLAVYYSQFLPRLLSGSAR